MWSLLLPGDRGPICGLCPYTYDSLLANLWLATSSLDGFSALFCLSDQFPAFSPLCFKNSQGFLFSWWDLAWHLLWHIRCVWRKLHQRMLEGIAGASSPNSLPIKLPAAMSELKVGCIQGAIKANTEAFVAGGGPFSGLHFRKIMSQKSSTCSTCRIIILWGLHFPHGFSNAV